MATKIVLRGATASAVYDDCWRPIYEALGCMAVRRATDVEFDDHTAEWVATLRNTGQVIARGHNRNAVIQEEIRYLEREKI